MKHAKGFFGFNMLPNNSPLQGPPYRWPSKTASGGTGVDGAIDGLPVFLIMLAFGIRAHHRPTMQIEGMESASIRSPFNTFQARRPDDIRGTRNKINNWCVSS